MRQEHLQTLPCKEEENRTLGSACRVPFLIFTEDRRYASGNWEQVPAVFFSAFTIFAEDRIRFSNLCVQARTIALTFHYLCPGGVSVRIVYPGSSDWFKKIVTMYRIIVSLLFVFGLYGGVSAQSLASFKERLSQPAGSAAVTVVEHGDAAGVVSRESQSNDRIRFKGYRIGIFFDNGAEARANALAAKQTFETAFPDIPVYLVYENPYFKVSAGNCVTSEEAIVLLGKIRSQFPEAYLMREDLTVAALIR